MNNFIAKLTKRLEYSELAFKRAVFLGFVIAVGLEFLIYPFERKIGLLLMQLVVGVGFLGIMFNLGIMFLTDIVTKIFPRLSNRERNFGLVMYSHLPLTLGLIVGIIRVWFPELSAKVCLMLLEGLSLVIMTILLTRVAKYR